MRGRTSARCRRAGLAMLFRAESEPLMAHGSKAGIFMARSIAVVSARGSFCHPASVDRRCDAAGPIRDGQQFSRKGLAPFAEVEGQCHDRGSGLLALGDQDLEVLTLAGHERFQAETVDDQQGIQISVLSLRPIL